MRILLIDHSCDGGHHPEYKVLLENAFRYLGNEVFSYSIPVEEAKGNSQSLPLFIRKNRILSFFYWYIITIWKIRRTARIHWQIVFDQVRLVNPDLIFFEYIDVFIRQYLSMWDIDKKLSIPFSGILFTPLDTKLMNRPKLRLFHFDPYHVLKSKWCNSIGVLSDDSVSVLSNIIRKPVIELPDIVDYPKKSQDSSLCQIIQRIADGRMVIGIWGVIAPRKGINEYLQMYSNLPSEKYFFVIGGKIAEEVVLELEKKQINSKMIPFHKDNLYIINSWLTDDQLLSGMSSCDLIFAAYPDWKFTSGILGKAAAIRIPILVNDGYVMARQVRNFSLGFIKQEKDNIIDWILTNTDKAKDLRSLKEFKDGCLKYCETYSYENWCKSLSNLLKLTIRINKIN